MTATSGNARFGWARYLTMGVIIGLVLGVVLAALLIALDRPSWGVGLWSVSLILTIIAPILAVVFRLIAQGVWEFGQFGFAKEHKKPLPDYAYTFFRPLAVAATASAATYVALTIVYHPVEGVLNPLS